MEFAISLGSEPVEISFPVVQDERGRICVIERFAFPIQRIYYLFDVPAGEVRGSHAHMTLCQLLVPLSGSFRLDLSDGEFTREHVMNNPERGILVPPGYWRTLSDFSAGAICLVAASQEYDEKDYIRDFDAFCAWRRGA